MVGRSSWRGGGAGVVREARGGCSMVGRSSWRGGGGSGLELRGGGTELRDSSGSGPSSRSGRLQLG
ncbi:hypothetical protein E2562_031775 [Oryza meyeriana var. granulata]|uniref:Uncharacterized protein n=1 Tax=Oryza meyeriana var. granulata TaxID=110450 RepID=A0A6G1CA20_9ORYZ|nr:hypothetical protein E2562_031775 [Oryza meyeriana var. granulata]